MRLVLPSEEFFKYVDEGRMCCRGGHEKMPVFKWPELLMQPNF